MQETSPTASSTPRVMWPTSIPNDCKPLTPNPGAEVDKHGLGVNVVVKNLVRVALPFALLERVPMKIGESARDFLGRPRELCAFRGIWLGNIFLESHVHVRMPTHFVASAIH
jgi:hypothetical protein